MNILDVIEKYKDLLNACRELRDSLFEDYWNSNKLKKDICLTEEAKENLDSVINIVKEEGRY
jgi:hypothetical protein